MATAPMGHSQGGPVPDCADDGLRGPGCGLGSSVADHVPEIVPQKWAGPLLSRRMSCGRIPIQTVPAGFLVQPHDALALGHSLTWWPRRFQEIPPAVTNAVLRYSYIAGHIHLLVISQLANCKWSSLWAKHGFSTELFFTLKVHLLSFYF